MWIAWLEIERPAARPAEPAARFGSGAGFGGPTDMLKPTASGQAEADSAVSAPDRTRDRVLFFDRS